MMKLLVVILGALIALEVVVCRPSADPRPGAITRDIRVALPGSEKINRRSVEYQENSDISTEDDTQEEYDEAASDYYSPEGGSVIVEREAPESGEDMAGAESNIVFHPLFASRKRSVERKRTSRSVSAVAEEPKEDEMETAESGMVFLPLFRSKTRFEEKQRVRRSPSAEEDKLDDMDTAENGMVFLPLFRSKDHSELRRRLRRSVDDSSVKTSSHVIGTLDDLELAEDLVFQPVSNRRFRFVRSVLDGDIVKDVGDMDAAENGLIFRPLFRTKPRDI